MTEAQQSLALGGIALEVTDAYERTTEQQLIEAARSRQERWGFQWFTSVFTQFQSGAVEVGDILSPLRQYLGARAGHIQSIYDLNTALSQLAMVTGEADLSGAPADDCRAPIAAPPSTDAGAGVAEGGTEEDDIEAILRASQVVESPPVLDAGVPHDVGVARDARAPGRDGGIARPR
jgi:hypothetical protein